MHNKVLFFQKIISYFLSSFIWVASILSEKSMFIDQRYGYCNRESSTYFLPVVFLMVMAMLLSEYRSCITIWPAAANKYANVGIGTRYVVYTLRSWIILSEGKMCWRGWSWSFTNLTIWQSIFSSIQNENVWIDFVQFFSVKIDKHSGSIIQDLRVFTYIVLETPLTTLGDNWQMLWHARMKINWGQPPSKGFSVNWLLEIWQQI